MHTGSSPVGATLVVKNPFANAGDIRDAGSIFELGISPGGGHTTHSNILACRSYRQRSLVVYSPWGRKESDTAEATTQHHAYWNAFLGLT